MKFDFDNPDRLLYQQIADELKDTILKGEIGEEEQIPSSTEISVTYRINPATVNKGVNMLVEEGIIYKKRGIGMFVSGGAKDMIKKQRIAEFYEKYILPLLGEADKLGLTAAQVVEYINGKGENNNDRNH